MKDWRGTTVTPGAKVIYTTRQGSHMTHHEGTILAVDDDTATVEVHRNSWGSDQKSPVKVGGKNMTVFLSFAPQASDDSA